MDNLLLNNKKVVAFRKKYGLQSLYEKYVKAKKKPKQALNLLDLIQGVEQPNEENLSKAECLSLLLNKAQELLENNPNFGLELSETLDKEHEVIHSTTGALQNYTTYTNEDVVVPESVPKKDKKDFYYDNEDGKIRVYRKGDQRIYEIEDGFLCLCCGMYDQFYHSSFLPEIPVIDIQSMTVDINVGKFRNQKVKGSFWPDGISKENIKIPYIFYPYNCIEIEYVSGYWKLKEKDV